MDQLNQCIVQSQSAIKAQRDQATQYLQGIKLDGPTTELLLQYISNDGAPDQNRQLAAVLLKNKIKTVFGSHSYTHYDEKAKQTQQDQGELLNEDDPDNMINEQGKQILMSQLVNIMMHFSGKGQSVLSNLFLEMIALMARKYVQKEWPQLFATLIH